MDADDNTEYYFESEQLALKHNQDYYSMLKYIATLESQKLQAIKDIEQLKLTEKDAMNDPDGFMQLIFSDQLKDKLPRRQDIANMPTIDWSRYAEYLPEQFKQHLSQNNVMDIPGIATLEPEPPNGNVEPEETSEKLTSGPWSVSDQKRLEQLLIQFPPEPIELRRFKKIAKALGNKTPTQVCSRVQKYFKKLKQHGLPIPGRAPRNTERKGTNRYRIRPSTFFPDNQVPVTMTELDDDIPGPSVDYDYSTAYSSTDSDLQLKINLIEMVKCDKERGAPFLFHTKYKCHYCADTPISGTRWHCTTCTDCSVDFCTDCVINQLDTNNQHPLAHRIVPVRSNPGDITDKIVSLQNLATQRSFLIANSSGEAKVKVERSDADGDEIYDRDYLHQSYSGADDYNYLDTNFRPV